MNNSEEIYLLGWTDTEMTAIKCHLNEEWKEYIDKNLDWWAKIEDYRQEIKANTGKVFVAVELEWAWSVDWIVDINHHDKRSWELPAIIQVLNRLGKEPSRNDTLTWAMDAWYVFWLESIWATQSEIAEFLWEKAVAYYKELESNWKESTTQNLLLAVENEDENTVEESIKAIDNAEYIGDMIVVRCSHSKTAPITVRLIDKQDFQNILILSEDWEVNYYWTGEMVRKISDKFSWGWSGWAWLYPHTEEAKEFWEQWGWTVPKNWFYGWYPNQEEILDYIYNCKV